MFVVTALWPKTNIFNNIEKVLIDSPRYKLFSFGLFILCAVTIILRYPSFLTEPRFWGEEYIFYNVFYNVNTLIDGFDVIIAESYYLG